MLQPLIVAVDDETDDLSFLRQLLQKTGVAHRFQPFSNGEAAVAGFTSLIGEYPTIALPLVCFLDIKMTAMNGFDLLRWIRSQSALAALPVLMFSSSDDPRNIDTVRELGAQGYLKKFPSISAMQTVLNEASDFALVASEKKTFLQWNYRFVDSGDAVATP